MELYVFGGKRFCVYSAIAWLMLSIAYAASLYVRKPITLFKRQTHFGFYLQFCQKESVIFR